MKSRKLLILLIFATFSIFIPESPTQEAITRQNAGDLAIVKAFEVAGINDIDWSSDGTKLIAGTLEDTWLFDFRSMESQQLKGIEGAIYEASFVDNTTKAAIKSNNSELIIYDLDRFEVSNEISLSGAIKTITDDGRIIASVEFNTSNEVVTSAYIQLLSNFTEQNMFGLIGMEYINFESPCEYLCGFVVAFSPDHSIMAVTAQVPEIESKIVNFSTRERYPLPKMDYRHSNFNHDGAILASTIGTPGFIARSLVLIDTETTEILSRAGLHLSSAPVFSSSGEMLAIGGYDNNSPNPDEAAGLVYIFDVEQALVTGILQPLITLPAEYPPSAVMFSPDNNLIAVGDLEGNLTLWGIPYP